ncbi:DUF2911 domain-containing protein [Ilyomonas limi]|uniref:DUF2911 domain-containing protein n=1 Tax=Ilyomonas limi TaxID=2575867 RepID=A0A4U3LCY4_9BACT|nr:DUF2911 domain-containing protein [Ilyomonas limi]TKK71767.1 DUF2911 domain-containing protein [Ilyomonas limi]
MYNQLMRSRNGYLINRLVICFYLSALSLLVSCTTSPTEQYGFVTKLGTDTIAVESVTRQGSKLTSDEVDRFPLVRVRHTEIDLNEDGSIRHLVMNIHTPGEPVNERERKVTVDVTSDKVHISKTDNTGTVNRDFATNGGIVEAHLPQMYSLYELYFAAALKHAVTAKMAAGSPVEIRQFYIDREFDRFPLGRGRVTPLGGGRVEITHDWLSGTGEAMMDSGYHMLSYSGARTTYKVKVNRIATPADIKNIATQFETAETKNGVVKAMSVRDTARAQIGNAKFTVDYSRPLMRGRQLLGDVLPYDRVWRTGANAATQFATSVPVKLAGMQVPAGTYTLWTVPHRASVDLIVNKQTGQWGTEFNSSRNLGIAEMTSQAVVAPVETFTISIVPLDTKHGTLVMEWGFFKWTAPIEVP